MIDIRVQILNVTAPASFEDPGGLFVDLDSPSISMRRVAEELNEINLIKFGGVRTFTVPDTAKNLFIFREFIAASPIDFDYTPLECRIFVGGNVLRETKIGASNYSESEGIIELIATKANDYWIIGAQALRLPQIPYEDIEFSQDTIEASHAAGPQYTDGDVGIFFPYAYYGKPFLDRQFTVEYMRWTYHLLRLLREGFRTFGWCLECEALESTIGRRIHIYAIDPNAYSNQELIEANKAVADTGSFERDKQWTVAGSSGFLGFGGDKLYAYHFVTLFDNVTQYDPGANVVGGRYYGFGVFKFSITFQYYPGQLRSEVIRCEFLRNDPGGPVTVYQEEFRPTDEFTGVLTDIHEHVFEAEVSLGANQSITVAIYAESYFKTINIHNMIMRVTPVAVYPQRGETLNPAEYLRNDPLMDPLKGWVHAMRGKLEVVPGERTLRILPNYGVDDTFWGTLEAYYRDTLIDLQPDQIRESGTVTPPTSKPDRYQLIRWKESTDPSVKALGLDKLTPLYSKTIDLGEQYPEGYTEHTNPYFEPTNSDWIYDFSPEDYEHIPINLPILLDHIPEEGSKKISTDIGPRLLYIHTAAGQSFPLESGLALCRLGWEGTEVTSWSTAYMRNAFLHTDDQMNLVFGDPLNEIKNTLGNVFWRGWIYANIAAAKLGGLFDLKPGQFFGFSFRDAYAFVIRGNTIIANLISIDDYDPVAGISTPMTFIPRSLTGVVSSEDNPDICDTYSYQLAVTFSDPTYTFTVTTDNPEHPAESTVEYRYEGSGTWTEAGSLSDPTGPFYVRFNIGGDCPKTIIKYIDPCGNVPAIQIDYSVDSTGQNCVTATIGGLLLDAIDSTDLEYELDQSDSWSPYTPGNKICGSFTEICFRGTITFDNPCDPYELDEQCFQIPPDTDCNLNHPEIEIIHEGLDAFRFDVGGSYDSDIGSFHFFYKHTGEDDTAAKRWTDQNPIVGTDYLVKLHVFWCDDCPPVCTDWIAVEEPAPLMAALQSSDEGSPWDFSKVPNDRKKEAKDLIYRGKKADLARLHNELELSEHEYCCGADLNQSLKWWRWGLDKGYLDED